MKAILYWVIRAGHLISRAMNRGDEVYMYAASMNFILEMSRVQT